jgi:hypothetical protein
MGSIIGRSLVRPDDASLPTPLGYWKMDEAAGVTRVDSGSGGNNLTDVGADCGVQAEDYWKTGENSADFEKTTLANYMTAGDVLDMNGTDFTICAWVKLESGGSQSYLVSKGTAGGTTGFHVGFSGTQTLRAEFETSTNESTGTISVGKWHHVAWVFDDTANTVTYYIDGNVDSIDSSTATITDVADIFTVGGRSNVPPALNFDGLVKDLAVWQTKITPIQMKSLALGQDLESFALRPDAATITTPTSYWKLNELSSGAGAITRVDSVGSNNLTDNNTVTTGGGYIEGAGADFEADNSEYLSITNAAQTGLDLDNKFSISAWVKLESTVTGLGMIVGKQGAGSSDFAFYVNDFASSNRLELRLDSTVITSDAADGLTVGVWTQVGVTYDQTNVIIYKDGVAIKTTAHSTDLVANTDDFTIGANDVPDANTAFDGLIADVAVWGTTDISAAEMASIASGLDLNLQGVVSYWDMEEASGTRSDSVGSNDLTDNNTVGQATGQVGNGADFESTNSEYLSITDGSQTDLDLTSDFTIMLWYKPEANGVIQEICNKGPDTTSYGIRRAAANQYSIIVTNTSTTGTSTTTAGVFNHVAGVFDGAQQHIYVDSDNELSTASTAPPTDVASDFQIGTQATPANYADGVMDEFIVAKRYFREEEIKAAYNKGLNGLAATFSDASGANTGNMFLAF